MWACQVCTLEQSDRRQTCAACLSVRPDAISTEYLEHLSSMSGFRNYKDLAKKFSSKKIRGRVDAMSNKPCPLHDQGRKRPCMQANNPLDICVHFQPNRSRSTSALHAPPVPLHDDGMEGTDELACGARGSDMAPDRVLADTGTGATEAASVASTHRDVLVGESAEQRPMRTHKPAKRMGIDDVEAAMSQAERQHLRLALRNSQLIDRMNDVELPEAPTFYPTVAQFQDPIGYIAHVRREAQAFGACKIVPPDGWREKAFELPDSMAFEPRLMPLHKLQQGCSFQMAPSTTLAAFRAQAEEMKAAFCERHRVGPYTENVHTDPNDTLAAADADTAVHEERAVKRRRQQAAKEAAVADVVPPGGPKSVSAAQRQEEKELERLFWRLVRTESEHLIVPYGADLDTSTHSSGFDGLDGGAWNLKNLARAKGSLLDETVDVPGVSSPWLYVGGLFGAFCWHTEDLWMFSCSHLHAGATKTWYVVPAVAASKFEKATRALLPSVFQDAPDLLYQLVAMVAPADLEAQGVPVYTLQQRAGEFIVTFPRAYHAGFSHGFNVAEAVNFASADWLPFGRNAMQCYVRHRRTPVFSVERLLWRLALATTPPISLSTADWVLPELTAVVEEELRSRETLPTGCRHLLLLGHSPVDTAVLAHLAAACNIDQRRQEKVTARIAKEAWREHGKDPRKQPLHRLHWAPPPKEHCDEFCSLGRATNGFQTFEEDALTCLECGRDLFLSGVTALEPPPKSSAAR
ncbi:jarid1a protein [Chrysochromulina tobinii]|uniref:Jarid1a protein n=1 Tax=Chrysochromulina tobinii TaxID=1460289 RepID=A0A0M0LQV5_9EUKA|nr:jarid1a protein [Chrysochromulina tobinii]|eukprot:KOO53282.1 jarid1a protein [Chrysochromulina sp. CCMP291]